MKTNRIVLGIPVHFDPSFTGVAQARGFWPFKRISVGPRWVKLKRAEQHAVLYHEAGHCKLFHMEQRLLYLPILFLSLISKRAKRIIADMTHGQELEADGFAAQHGFGIDLASMLMRHAATESQFYPDNRIRVARLKEKHHAQTLA
jgi:Zn-dependent protease with chaperone function